MSAVYSGGSAIGMHDRWKSWKSSRPGPSQSSGRSAAATVEPRSPRLPSRKRFHKRLRSTKRFVPGGKSGPPDWLGVAAITSARIGSLAPAEARRARMCFRAVRGSTQPSAMQAASVEPAPISPSRSSASFLPHRGLRGMRCSGSILFVLCRPVPRKAWQIIVATRISCLTPSLPMTQRSG